MLWSNNKTLGGALGVIVAISLLLSSFAAAQNNPSVLSGKVTDKVTGEPLPGVVLVFQG